jgi:hypothetical protein
VLADVDERSSSPVCRWLPADDGAHGSTEAVEQLVEDALSRCALAVCVRRPWRRRLALRAYADQGKRDNEQVFRQTVSTWVMRFFESPTNGSEAVPGSSL